MTLRTILGATAALVVAITGGMLGAALAAPPAPAEPWTVRTLVQPAASGPDVGASDTVESSARIGVTAESITANALAVLRAASSAPDPQAAAEALVDGRTFDSPDDPCVLTGQTPPGSCPAGLYGNVVAEPAARIERATLATDGACATEPGELAVSVVTDRPVPVTVSWWAADGPVRERAAQSGAYCVILDDLIPSAAYTVHVAAGEDWRRFRIDGAGRPVRPQAAVYAPTDDLVAVTVPHRRGETVEVLPNVLSSDEPQCDPFPSGYDLAVRELGVVTGSVSEEVLEAASFDPAFTERTTFAFDIGEGLTVFLCAVVRSADGEENYTAQAIVQTADRLVPELIVTSARVRDLPGWGLTAWLPSGERCGSWRPETLPTNRDVHLTIESASLCDTTDPIPPAIRPAEGAEEAAEDRSEGRGVLPYSAGDRSALVVDLDFPQVGPAYTTLDLGPAAHCTGWCDLPARPAYYTVQGQLGQATLMLFWSQGSSNGAAETSVFPVVDAATVVLPGPQLDVGQSRLRLNATQPETRGVTAALPIWADRPASYVARLVPAEGEAPCDRPGAALEFSGDLLPEPFNRPTFLEFTGLCHGTEYRAIVELTDNAGRVTTWGVPGELTNWGSASTVAVPAVATAASVSVRLSGASAPSAYLTLRVDGRTVVGPRLGGCPGIGFAGTPSEAVIIPVGETTRFSGVVELPNAAQGASPQEPCVPFWGTGRAGIPFELDVPWEQLMGHPPGTAFEIAVIDHAVRGLSGDATVVAIVTIVVG